jgi:hypothetical protein
MAGDVRIDTLNIGNVVVVPDAIDGLSEFVLEQVTAGADPEVMRDTGYAGVPQEAPEPDDTPTSEEQAEIYQSVAERITQEMIDADDRSGSLRKMVSEVDKASNMEGFRVNHERKPRKPEVVSTVRTVKKTEAIESLEEACGKCIFRNSCRLVDNLERWLDVHPYKRNSKRDPVGKRRPGSLPVVKVESRKDFLEALREDPRAHCDPAKRK